MNPRSPKKAKIDPKEKALEIIRNRQLNIPVDDLKGDIVDLIIGLQQENDGLQQKNDGLQQKNVRLQQENVVLQEKVERWTLYRLINDVPKITLTCTGSIESNTKPIGHNAVQLQEIETELNSDQLKNIAEGKLHKPSLLLADIESNRSGGDDDDDDGGGGGTELELFYKSEADISSFVINAVKDALQLVTLSRPDVTKKYKLRLYHEHSLWTGRPDHIILVDETNDDPVLVVEDKKPWPKTQKIPKGVQGQMLDYLMDLKCLGHSAPCAILTTFNSSWMFWPKEEDNDTLAASSESTNHLTTPSRPTASEKSDPSSEITISPPEIVTDGSSESNEDSTYESFQGQEYIYHSQRYDFKDLVPLMYTAILKGLNKNPTAPTKRIKDDSGNYSGTVLQLTEKGYGWGKLTLNKSRLFSCKEGTYFATARIGRGKTSRVFKAYDHKGRPCVIKMYVKRYKDKVEDKTKSEQMDMRTFRQTGETLCAEEVGNFQKLYPFLRDKVSTCIVNTYFPCVVMPFFKPLTKEERLEDKLKKKVENCLQNFTKHKLKYAESDLRWRHVGYYEEGKDKKLIMFDLAELEENEDNDNQLESLWKRLPAAKEEEELES